MPVSGPCGIQSTIEAKGTTRHMDGAWLVLKSEEKGKLYQR
jgi:hypothetical protein